MINNYVKMICGMLELPMPQVFYNDSALEPGQHARLTPDGKQLYLRKLKTASLDQLFAASSELRRELSIASIVASLLPNDVSLKYPSPSSPKPAPGVPTT